jgi:hypothetical protein
MNQRVKGLLLLAVVAVAMLFHLQQRRINHLMAQNVDLKKENAKLKAERRLLHQESEQERTAGQLADFFAQYASLVFEHASNTALSNAWNDFSKGSDVFSIALNDRRKWIDFDPQ